jgi:hypothetical protein
MALSQGLNLCCLWLLFAKNIITDKGGYFMDNSIDYAFST